MEARTDRNVDMLNRVVRVVQMIAAASAAAFVFLLFANEPQEPAPVPQAGADVDAGAAIYASRCAGCHGAEGTGGFGPPLAGVVADRFPEVDDQVVVVANGRGSMPSFADTLTPEQIEAVVEYTRTGLG